LILLSELLFIRKVLSVGQISPVLLRYAQKTTLALINRRLDKRVCLFLWQIVIRYLSLESCKWLQKTLLEVDVGD
jgi:hypothetical protein